MTGREKIEAAFSADGTPEIPAVICYEGIYVRDHWEQLTSCPWWYQEAPDIECQVQWRRDMLSRSGQEWFSLPGFYSRQEREHLKIEERPEGVFRVDKGTGSQSRLTRPQISGWSELGGVQSIRLDRLPETVEAIDALIPITPDFDRTHYLAEGRGDLAARLLDEFGDLYPISSVGAPLWATYSLWGFEGMMTMVGSRPDLAERACERYLGRSVHSVRQAAALGTACIWIEDCLTDMLSPDAFAELNVPFVRRLVEEIRALGMKSIYYFCGDPAGKWGEILSVGADALSLEESKKGFEIEIEDMVDREAGRCTVLGNLDAVGVLEQGTEEQLRAEIERQIAAGRRNGGRFVMSIGSPVTPGTPVERVRRYCDLVRELGSA